MSLGPHVPEWNQLHRCLSELAADARAVSASVLDAWGLPWCCAPDHNIFVARDARNVLRRALAMLKKPLPQGGSIDRIFSTGDVSLAHVRSFAGVYLLILRYEPPVDLNAARASAARALPEIEALITALPPPHGPGTGSAEALRDA